MATIQCAYCNGKGRPAYKSEPCPVCLGRGELVLSYSNGIKCAFCEGRGHPYQKNDPCPVCHGAGVVAPVLHE